MEPKAALEASQKAGAEASSLSLSLESGQATQANVVTDGAQGSFTQGEQKLEFTVRGDKGYYRADKAYWTEALNGLKAKDVEAKATQAAGKWVGGPLTSPYLQRLSSFKNIDTVMKSTISINDQMNFASAGSADGMLSIRATPPDGSAASITYAIAEMGDPFLSKVTAAQGEQSATMSFSDWNKDMGIEWPVENEVVDITTILPAKPPAPPAPPAPQTPSAPAKKANKDKAKKNKNKGNKNK